MPREKYLVEINRPDDMPAEELAAYIEDAITGYRGGFEKEHPLVGYIIDVNAHRQRTRRELQSIAKESVPEPKPWGEVVAMQHFPEKKNDPS